MKTALLAVVIVMTTLAGSLWAITQNPASNATADSADTAQTIVLRDSSGNFATNSVSLDGPFQPKSRTIAQLRAITPAQGDMYFCSNCTGAVGATGKIVIATGTSVANFADAAGGTFQ